MQTQNLYLNVYSTGSVHVKLPVGVGSQGCFLVAKIGRQLLQRLGIHAV
jgi:hypothetical protein